MLHHGQLIHGGNMPYPPSRRLPIDIGEDTIDVGGGDDDDEEEYYY